eukprot:4887935-Alexandrium_andersonii.AAC.1
MAPGGRPGPQGACAGAGPRPTCRRLRPRHGRRPPRPAFRPVPSERRCAKGQGGPRSVGPRRGGHG